MPILSIFTLWIQRTKSCFVSRSSTPRFLKAGEITSASDSGIPTVEHPLSERPSDKVLQRTKSTATGKISPRRREEILLRFFASSCLRGEQDACAPRRTAEGCSRVPDWQEVVNP